MTQDPYGQPPGPSHFVRGEIVPDDEGNVTPPTVPVTRFQKVASAVPGDGTDPADAPSSQEADAASSPSPDPDWTWPGTARSTTTTNPDATGDARDHAQPGETDPEDVGAVRSPDTAGGDHWDEQDEGPEHAAAVTSPDAPAADTEADAAPSDAQDPAMTQPDLYGATASGQTEAAAAAVAGTGPAPETGAAEPGTAEPDAAEPDAAEPGAAEPGGAEPDTVGRHAAPAEGLRPGESDPELSDFSDLTYGSLLPDAAEFKTRWQQVQFRFVDDPPASVTEAADVIAQVTAKLEAAIQERQRAIAERQRALRDRWSEGKSTDTESLRETLLMYRSFLNQLTGPKMS